MLAGKFRCAVWFTFFDIAVSGLKSLIVRPSTVKPSSPNYTRCLVKAALSLIKNHIAQKHVYTVCLVKRAKKKICPTERMDNSFRSQLTISQYTRYCVFLSFESIFLYTDRIYGASGILERKSQWNLLLILCLINIQREYFHLQRVRHADIWRLPFLTNDFVLF